MLHTMIQNSFPTKAEIGDITNAILDGASATMLSGETAVGAHPVAAVEVMAKVARAAEAHMMAGQATCEPTTSVADGMSEAVAAVCRSLPISKIVAITRSGFAARQLSQPVLAVSDDEMAARSFALLPGVEGIWVDIPFSQTTTDHIPACLRRLWKQGHLMAEDLVLVAAVSYPNDGNRMNLLETHKVGDLIASLGWGRAETRRKVS
ncbi:MAG: pyruvate kinase, partial [Alphaproteobacteria bacterium]